MNADRVHADEDTPDEIRGRMVELYQDSLKEQLAPLVEAGEITPDDAARAVKIVMDQWFVKDTIESFVARHTGGLH